MKALRPHVAAISRSSTGMTAHDYQLLAARTLIERPDFTITDEHVMLIWNAIGLGGESGELLEHIKKGVFHQHGLDSAYIVKELGDILWYVAAIATTLGLDLGDIMEQNIAKLQQRYPDGYSPEASQRRVDVE